MPCRFNHTFIRDLYAHTNKRRPHLPDSKKTNSQKQATNAKE